MDSTPRLAVVVLSILGAATTLVQAQSQVTSTDVQTLLSLQNAARANVCAGPLSWNDTIASKAQLWASGCVYKHNLDSSGYQVYGYGENIAAGTGTESVTTACNSWINEDQYFTCSTNTCQTNQVCGHYTQVIWQSTTMVGCGVAYCNTNSPFSSSYGTAWTFWVCDYYPPGNYVGEAPVPSSQCNGCPAGSSVPTNPPATTQSPTSPPATTPPSTTQPPTSPPVQTTQPPTSPPATRPPTAPPTSPPTGTTPPTTTRPPTAPPTSPPTGTTPPTTTRPPTAPPTSPPTGTTPPTTTRPPTAPPVTTSPPTSPPPYGTSTSSPPISTTPPITTTSSPTQAPTGSGSKNGSAETQSTGESNRTGGIVAGVLVGSFVLAVVVLAVIFRRQIVDKYHDLRGSSTSAYGKAGNSSGSEIALSPSQSGNVHNGYTTDSSTTTLRQAPPRPSSPPPVPSQGPPAVPRAFTPAPSAPPMNAAPPAIAPKPSAGSTTTQSRNPMLPPVPPPKRF